jgi:hypothetical protein
MTMFEGLAQPDIMGTLAHLEPRLPLLSEDDQVFILGCRMTLEAGGALTAQNQQEVRRIASTIVAVEHNTMDKPISVSQMLHDLGSAIHMLSPEEKAFLGPIARKVKASRALTAGEMQRLLAVHASKGF